MTFDLHENEPEWNIRTEHEGMFTEMGIKIKDVYKRQMMYCRVTTTRMKLSGKT